MKYEVVGEAVRATPFCAREAKNVLYIKLYFICPLPSVRVRPVHLGDVVGEVVV